jgi:hypothetical protein
MRLADLDFVTFNEDYELRDVANDPILKLAIGLLDRYQPSLTTTKASYGTKTETPACFMVGTSRRVYGKCSAVLSLGL